MGGCRSTRGLKRAVSRSALIGKKFPVLHRWRSLFKYFRLVRMFDLPPLQLQGASLWVAVPRVETGVKPWAEWREVRAVWDGSRPGKGRWEPNTGWKPMLH